MQIVGLFHPLMFLNSVFRRHDGPGVLLGVAFVAGLTPSGGRKCTKASCAG